MRFPDSVKRFRNFNGLIGLSVLHFTSINGGEISSLKPDDLFISKYFSF
jgi:hypothetical protein